MTDTTRVINCDLDTEVHFRNHFIPHLGKMLYTPTQEATSQEGFVKSLTDPCVKEFFDEMKPLIKSLSPTGTENPGYFIYFRIGSLPALNWMDENGWKQKRSLQFGDASRTRFGHKDSAYDIVTTEGGALLVVASM